MEYTRFWNQVNKITNYEIIRGNSLDIQNLDGASEIRSDLKVERVVGTNIWGTLTDCHNKPLSQQVVKLISHCDSDTGEYFKVVDCTMTDCNGYYRLDTYGQKDDYYNILVESSEPVALTIESNATSDNNCYGSQEVPLSMDAEKEDMKEQWNVSHQINVYDYSNDEPIYRSLNNRAGAKFYANNTYPYRRK